MFKTYMSKVFVANIRLINSYLWCLLQLNWPKESRHFPHLAVAKLAKLRPEGTKKIVWRPPPPPLSKGLDDQAPPYLNYCSSQFIDRPCYSATECCMWVGGGRGERILCPLSFLPYIITIEAKISGRFGEGPGWPASPPPLLFLDQNEARRAKKKFLSRVPPYLKVWMTAPPPSYLKVWILDPPLKILVLFLTCI